MCVVLYVSELEEISELRPQKLIVSVWISDRFCVANILVLI